MPDDADICLGLWTTDDDHVRQQLLPAGRYIEARGSTEAAYTGAYQITGDHIEYQDDSGFAVDGDFVEDDLHPRRHGLAPTKLTPGAHDTTSSDDQTTSQQPTLNRRRCRSQRPRGAASR